MRLGAHLRISGGLDKALAAAERLGCETMQVFAGNPNAWRESVVPPDSAEAFRLGVTRLGLRPVVLHTAYLLNLAAPNDLVYARSVHALSSALDRAQLLGAGYVVTHIGSHCGLGYEWGVARIKAAVESALSQSPGQHGLLLEAGAGAGHTIGSRFEELADLLAALGAFSDRVGVALDTAHLWGAGYDVSTSDALERLLAEFHRVVGLDRLRLIHLNDTKAALGSRADRHWHIGQGQIGIAGFQAIVNHEAFRELPGILETPIEEPGADERNLRTLRSLREDDAGLTW